MAKRPGGDYRDAMALTATVLRFELVLADADRGVYETLDLRVARHPSESERFLVARVIARALEHAEGVEFGKGLSVDDEPALHQRDLRGDLLAWIDVGSPSVLRLHKASKTGARVVVYTWKGGEALAAEVAASVHRAEELEMNLLEIGFLDTVAATLERTNRWELSVSGGTLYLAIGGAVTEGTVRRLDTHPRDGR
jgi:uncharacterized protein YaeQ